MPNFHRRRVRGATYFFTLVTHRRQRLLVSNTARLLLRQVINDTRNRWPFEIDAWVLLPDHLHTMWTLPHCDANYSVRWAFLKKEFTKRFLAAGGREGQRSEGEFRDRRRAVWQAKYWEHVIRDAKDYERHFHYIHFNPVRHGYVENVVDYPYSTFHRHLRSGLYPPSWPDHGMNEIVKGLEAAEMGE